MEYESKYVKELIEQVGEVSEINWYTLDIYGKYLEGEWFPVDAGSFDDAFDMGREIGYELRLVDELIYNK